MRRLTETKVRGEVSSLNGEVPVNFVHRYKTRYEIQMDEEELEDVWNGIEGVLDVNAERTSREEGADRYEVEVHMESREILRKEEYQDLLHSTV